MRCSYPPCSGRYIAGRTVVRLVGWLVHMSYLYYKSPNLKSLVCNAHQPLIMAVPAFAAFRLRILLFLSVWQYDKIAWLAPTSLYITGQRLYMMYIHAFANVQIRHANAIIWACVAVNFAVNLSLSSLIRLRNKEKEDRLSIKLQSKVQERTSWFKPSNKRNISWFNSNDKRIRKL